METIDAVIAGTSTNATQPVTTMTVPNGFVLRVDNILVDLGLSMDKTSGKEETTYTGQLTAAQEVNLRNKVQIMSLKYGMKTIVAKAGGLVADTADTAVNDVAVPIAKVGFSTVAAVGRIGAKATILSAASIVNSVANEGGRAIHDIKRSDEYTEAKTHLGAVKSKVFGFFGLASDENHTIKFG